MKMNKVPSPRELQLLNLVIKERTGREVAVAFEHETEQRLPYGTVYTLLDEMEHMGWVDSREDVRNGRRVRLYKIRSPGMRALNRGRDYYRALSGFGLPQQEPG
ncbi:MAG: PadR family transcriptional regulator [Planctomycetes bacterium]|nr:PadR family transcriptional regulator [Planctomycetota bacterium]